jgi:hypothetical protein
MEIIIPETFLQYVDDSDLLQYKINKYWDEYKEWNQYGFISRLSGLKEEWDIAKSFGPDFFKKHYSDGDLKNNTGTFRSFLRLAGGYNAIFEPTGIQAMEFLLCSESVWNLRSNNITLDKKTTSDHIFGGKDIGVDIFTTYEASGWDVQYMAYEWLPKYFYYWLQCELLKGEHQKEDKNDTNGVPRSKHTLQEKLNLDHYRGFVPLPLKVWKG